MNLSEIPTPDTDKLNTNAPVGVVWLSHARDLERCLAMARLALAPFANYACDEPHVDEPRCHNCIARDVLAFTAPKP